MKKAPPNRAKGPRDGRGGGKGEEAERAPGKGAGQRKGGKKGLCK